MTVNPDYTYRHPQVLYFFYHEKDLSQREIGQILGVSQTTIGRWMRRNDIEIKEELPNGNEGGQFEDRPPTWPLTRKEEKKLVKSLS